MTDLVVRRLREESEVLFKHLWTEDVDLNLILCHTRELLALAEQAAGEVVPTEFETGERPASYVLN